MRVDRQKSKFWYGSFNVTSLIFNLLSTCYRVGTVIDIGDRLDKPDMVPTLIQLVFSGIYGRRQCRSSDNGMRLMLCVCGSEMKPGWNILAWLGDWLSVRSFREGLVDHSKNFGLLSVWGCHSRVLNREMVWSSFCLANKHRSVCVFEGRWWGNHVIF